MAILDQVDTVGSLGRRDSSRTWKRWRSWLWIYLEEGRLGRWDSHIMVKGPVVGAAGHCGRKASMLVWLEWSEGGEKSRREGWRSHGNHIVECFEVRRLWLSLNVTWEATSGCEARQMWSDLHYGKITRAAVLRTDCKDIRMRSNETW